MYLYRQKRKNGDTYLAIKEKYYIPKKGVRDKTIESIGMLSELKKTLDDPVAYYTQYAKELTERAKSERTRTITIDTGCELPVGANDTRNVGYGALKELYRELNLDRFWNWKTRGRRARFSTDQIFRLLTFSRALTPGSKKHTFDTKGFFFEPFGGFTDDDMYHALDIIAENSEALQEWVFRESGRLCRRDMSVSYFDCTNFYFDISRPDVDAPCDAGEPQTPKYRKRGPEKNHRPDPIIGMGLLMDRNGIPVAYDLFPGNESEKVHMRPVIRRASEWNGGGRVIIVADRGLNTSDNIYWVNGDNKGDSNRCDGYVYGQSVRGADAEMKAWVLGGGYTTDKVASTGDDDDKVSFMHKSRIHPKVLHVNVPTRGGGTKKKDIPVDQKQMAYYSAKYARRQKADRDAMVDRATDLIAHPKKYDRVTSKGSAAYVKNIEFSKDTGEIIEGRSLELDTEKIAEEEKYDGYYCIVTSELAMSDKEIRDAYRGLARIEDSFKVMKTCFKSRPIYVWLAEHIEAHFAVCFLTLVLIRLLENRLGNKFPAGRILESLRNYNCVHLDANTWQFTYYDEIIDECGKSFGKKLNSRYKTQQEIQRLLRY